MNLDRDALRQQLRAARRILTDCERQVAADAVADQVIAWPAYVESLSIAGYWACLGELDLMPLFERAWATNKHIYLPIVVDDPLQTLRFAPYRPDIALRRNRFKIPEPDLPAAEWLLPQQLDLLLMPLVAFDAMGTRLGMGGGFYDRSFAFLLDPAYLGHRPCLLGVGYEFQKTATLLPREHWDVPLTAAITEAALYVFNP